MTTLETVIDSDVVVFLINDLSVSSNPLYCHIVDEVSSNRWLEASSADDLKCLRLDILPICNYMYIGLS